MMFYNSFFLFAVCLPEVTMALTLLVKPNLVTRTSEQWKCVQVEYTKKIKVEDMPPWTSICGYNSIFENSCSHTNTSKYVVFNVKNSVNKKKQQYSIQY